MPTATRNTVATGDTNNPFVELRQRVRLNHPPSVFNRTDELIPVGPKKKRPLRKFRFGYCDVCKWPLLIAAESAPLFCSSEDCRLAGM